MNSSRIRYTCSSPHRAAQRQGAAPLRSLHSATAPCHATALPQAATARGDAPMLVEVEDEIQLAHVGEEVVE
eukprot:CAMPEP_0182856526 /NCGR_PEP_ID=MMETSP0034_2-20130328/2488_1 /TAXON_ID=156128 /ORGANISM="Nephroselmis pyriformis, Strain CCMP717" /LENGTH=71 /DNA_ID=CAMNT_0024987613 /DNA_START=129 /DNA_END=342 /DNA_ORIENTATION=-